VQDKVHRVDPTTGVKTTVTSSGNLHDPRDVAFALDGSSLFVTDLNGGKIVRVDPVSLNSRNVGVARDVTVVVEKSLADPRETPGPADTAVVPTSIVPVTVRTPFATRGVAPDIPTGNYTFSVLAPISGAVLADAEVSRQDVRSARAVLRSQMWALSVTIFSAALLLAIGPLLSKRQMTKSTTEYVWLTLAVAAIVVLLTLVPVLVPYYQARVAYRNVRNSVEIEMHSADLRSYVSPHQAVGIWRWLPSAAAVEAET